MLVSREYNNFTGKIKAEIKFIVIAAGKIRECMQTVVRFDMARPIQWSVANIICIRIYSAKSNQIERTFCGSSCNLTQSKVFFSKNSIRIPTTIENGQFIMYA